jgi:hypothetical protein
VAPRSGDGEALPDAAAATAKRPRKRSAFLVLARGTEGALPKLELDRFGRSAQLSPPNLKGKAKLTEVTVSAAWEEEGHQRHKATLWRD